MFKEKCVFSLFIYKKSKLNVHFLKPKLKKKNNTQIHKSSCCLNQLLIITKTNNHKAQ